MAKHQQNLAAAASKVSDTDAGGVTGEGFTMNCFQCIKRKVPEGI